MAQLRFKDQIVKNASGVKGEIVGLKIIDPNNPRNCYYPKEVILGTIQANHCVLFILWDKQTTHQELPATSPLITPVVNTNNFLYPMLNLIEKVNFRGEQ